MRIAPHESKRGKIDRLSWRPRQDGTPLWKFPGAFAIESQTSFWHPIIVPELERGAESQMIAVALGGAECWK